ncbi:penicillin acylase family protein [Chiayiivirga flava]|uniref:Penicillin amidase n=1 Tax=Chiayiivirga flava TaxID=659595 RepID=A0A7W8D5E4_9GAMM|nr:penicillin acylase family protein [Chiayiivirga flava]MBB5208249.1 penicillin amidase [Chiayiivirga flava]
MSWLRRGLIAVFALALVVLIGATLLLRGSLATLDGTQTLPGLSAPVRVERDALGTASIVAADAADAARALGYVHAQERYFEMDLLRRSAAGELAALFGPMAIERDRQVRVHRIRARVQRDIDVVFGERRDVIAAYRDGVNAGLADLAVRPWPYLLLGAAPEPWQIEDSALAGYAMYFDLQDEANRGELARTRLRAAVPEALYRLLTRDGTAWDAPLQGEARGDATLPDAGTLDLRVLPATALSAAERTELHATQVVGSNNFAVAGARTTDGRALVADDMHLGLRAPALWFRARLQYADAQAPGGTVDVGGFSLPGLPVIVVGSNTHVAWGFTNSYGDWLDWVRVPSDAPVETIVETITVKGAPAQTLTVRETAWGPILHDTADGPLALLWTAHRSGALDLGLLRMNHAADLDAAVAIAREAGMPVQNMVAGDARGRIAWVPAGRVPRRVGDCDPTLALDPARGCDWQGWLAPSELSALASVDPPDGLLWTANARVADGEALRLIGDGGYDLGARQRQIRDALQATARVTEADLLALQLDDRALFLERWWQLLRDTVAGSDDPALRRLADASRTWEGRAAPAAVSYRLARGFRTHVVDAVAAGYLAPAKARLGEDFIPPPLAQFEGLVWPLLEQRPAHLLPPPHASWEALLADAARALDADLTAPGANLADRTWGERNTAAICHPLAAALPRPARSWLCMPPDPLAGDSNMPRVAAPAFGASQRMVVSPGHEADGIIQMPGGQSGHPLSPFWGAGHAAWVRGEASPFLPGETRYTLTLEP